MSADILRFPAAGAFVASVQHRTLHERKEVFRARRERFGLAAPTQSDLTQDHADPEDTAPAEYSPPAYDGA